MIAEHNKDETALAVIDNSLASGEILGTIVLPKNLGILSTRLPKPNYNNRVDEVSNYISKNKSNEVINNKSQKTKQLQIIDEMSKITTIDTAHSNHKPVNPDVLCDVQQSKVHQELKQKSQPKISTPCRLPFYLLY